MEQNKYVVRCRNESIILGNRNATYLNQPVIEGSVSNLEGHLLQIRGNAQGMFFDSHHREVPSSISTLKQQEIELHKEFEKYQLSRLQIGEPKPVIWPDHLEEKRQKLAAKIQIASEEIIELERMLAEAQEEQTKSRGSILTHPKYWGSGRLRDGQLVEIGPWKVGPDSDGLLRIQDESSPYKNMEIWRFRSQVLNPMSQEFILRQRNELKASLAENRPKKSLLYPVPPTYDAKNDNIEYPGDYDPSVIRKLKQSAE